MRAFKDDRGRAYNDIFPAIGKGDVNASVLYPGTIKAFHRHALQDDYWFVVRGHIRAILVEMIETTELAHSIPHINYPNWHVIDNNGSPVTASSAFTMKVVVIKPNVSEHYLSEGDSLHIPAGVWHGVQNLGSEEAVMLYHITTKYNESKPDEERAPWDKWHTWERSRK